LPVGELKERLRAVGGGDDEVAKILHGRYGAFRARALEEQLDAAVSGAGERRPMPEGVAAQLRELKEVVSMLEEQLVDPAVAKRREQASKAACDSRERFAPVQTGQEGRRNEQRPPRRS
jgi:hypothetical protein